MDYDTTSRSVTLTGGDLHYHEVGEGPVLLLLHGSGPGVSGWANFSSNLEFFANSHRVIVPDMPGYGKTSAALGASPPETVNVVLALLDALNIERADVIGNSFGGMIATQLAAHHGGRVRRLVSIGGIGLYTMSSFPAEGLRRLVDFVEDPRRETLVSWLKSMVYDESLVTEEMIQSRLELATKPEILAASRMVYSRDALGAIAASMRGPNALAGISHLPLIEAPTLLCWGRDDRVTPLDGALVPMRIIPKCELHVFPQCGHWTMIEQRVAFESAVGAFLSRE
ncbi:MAG: alpha/beta fold hydrolase [Sphingomonadaceae bacterium]|nr:alpha/beta fold hydrolase [Sphingomonadaceae bacterium]